MKSKANTTTKPKSSKAEPTAEDVEQVIGEAERALAADAEAAHQRAHPPDPTDGDDHGSSRSRKPSARRGAATTAGSSATAEIARRMVKGVKDRDQVVHAARRVASRQTAGLTDDQVLLWILEKPGRLRMLGGHLHEMFDADDLNLLRKLTRGRVAGAELYAAHNRPGLDAYRTGSMGTGGARYTQHKKSANPQVLKKAADKTHRRVRGKTELAVPRGTKVSEETARGMKGVRQTGRSAKDIDRVLKNAADPSKVRDVGTKAAQKVSLKAGAAGAAVGAGISVACDVKGLVNGEKSVGEVAENAAWSAGEAGASTVAAAGATVLAAPTIAAGTAALAGSTAAGTTALAAGLATLGPIGLGVGVSIGVGVGVKKLRKKLRG